MCRPVRTRDDMRVRSQNEWQTPLSGSTIDRSWKIQVCCMPHHNICYFIFIFISFLKNLTHFQRDNAMAKPKDFLMSSVHMLPKVSYRANMPSRV